MGKASRRKRQRREGRGIGFRTQLPREFRSLRFQEDSPRGKMSEALIELVEPYLDEVDGFDQTQLLFGLGAICWNISVLEETAPEEIPELLEDSGLPDLREFESLIYEIVERKRGLFPGDDRMILNWDLSVKPDGSYYLQAASAWSE